MENNELNNVNSQMSVFDLSSEISQINNSPANQWIELSKKWLKSLLIGLGAGAAIPVVVIILLKILIPRSKTLFRPFTITFAILQFNLDIKFDWLLLSITTSLITPSSISLPSLIELSNSVTTSPIPLSLGIKTEIPINTSKITIPPSNSLCLLKLYYKHSRDTRLPFNTLTKIPSVK